MKHLYYLLFTAVFCISLVCAQDWEHINVPSSGSVHKIIVNAENELVAFCRNYGVYISKNDGENWQRVCGDFTGGDFSSLGSDLVIAPNGNLFYCETTTYVSENNGNSWQWTQGPGGGVSAVYDSNNDIFMVTRSMWYGDNVNHYNSNDSTWTQVNNGITASDRYAIAIWNDTLYLATEAGVFTSVDNGENWTVSALTEDVEKIEINNAGVIFAAKDDALYRFEKAGNTWTTIVLDFDITDLFFDANDKIYATTSGTVFRSSDNGDTWTEISNGFPDTGYALLYPYGIVELNGELYLATKYSVYGSADSGDSWEFSGDGISANTVTGILINDNDDLIVCLDGIGIFRSADNGNTWSQIGSSGGYYECSKKNSNGDLFVGHNNGLLRSTDNGDNWTEIKGDWLGGTIAIDFTSGGDIFVATKYQKVYRSTDNGDNWEETAYSGALDALVITDNDNIIAGAGNTFFKSVDSGSTWTEVSNGFDNTSRILNLARTPSGTIIAADQGSKIFTSDDEGDNWEKRFQGDDWQAFTSLAVTSGGVIYAGTNSGHGMYRSADNGNHWTPVFTGDAVDSSVTVLYGAPDDFIYAAVKGSGIYRYQDFGGVAIQSEHNRPEQFRLEQNYPNPFNATTTISYYLPNSATVNISIYDLNGRLVDNVTNEWRNGGYHTVHWNAGNVSSGLYLYRIDAAGFCQVRKCLLVK